MFKRSLKEKSKNEQKVKIHAINVQYTLYIGVHEVEVLLIYNTMYVYTVKYVRIYICMKISATYIVHTVKPEDTAKVF